MRILFLLVFFWSYHCSLQAQLTINITSIPSNSPSGHPIYLAGNFNNWNSGDSDYSFRPTNNGYRLTVYPAKGKVDFKCTRGSWNTGETTSHGGYVPNRSIEYDGSPTSINISIAGWADFNGNYDYTSTASYNVHLLSESFHIPQLDRTRRIWLYLPPDYYISTKEYPVLYMHDGQSIFDRATSFSGEWGVDETLNSLFNYGDYGCIVVAIDNGEGQRLNEYSPWINTEYGGGEGDEYIDFIVNTLKPHIDTHYRSLPQREFTAMMGSSMGGLISMYAGIEFQETFGLLGIFSPAFWFADHAPFEQVDQEGKQANFRVYFMAGANESSSMVPLLQQMYQACRKEGFQEEELFLLVEQDGQHSEWFWAREFADAYLWLFQDARAKLLKNR